MLLPTNNNLLTNERVTPVFQGRPGFLCIQYIRVLNFRYTVFLCLKLGIKYSLMTNLGYKVSRVFLNFGILHEFSCNFWYIGRFISDILVFLFPPGRTWSFETGSCICMPWPTDGIGTD